MNLPMILTWVRIVLIPLVVGIYFLPETIMSISMQNWVGAWVFVFAAIMYHLYYYIMINTDLH